MIIFIFKLEILIIIGWIINFELSIKFLIF